MRHVLCPKENGGLGYKAEDIFLLGKSMGSGPASHMAAEFNPKALILMCPYTSIKNIVRDTWGSFFACFMAPHFDNLSHMSMLKCPLLCMHGTADNLIPHQHSEQLVAEHQKSGQFGKVVLIHG